MRKKNYSLNEKLEFTAEEHLESNEILQHLRQAIGNTLKEDDEEKLRQEISKSIEQGQIHRDVFGLNPILQALRTAQIAVDEIGLKRDGVLAVLLYQVVVTENISLEAIEKKFGTSVAHIIRGLVKIHQLYEKSPIVESENFRNLLISFSEDMRVILIMIGS